MSSTIPAATDTSPPSTGPTADSTPSAAPVGASTADAAPALPRGERAILGGALAALTVLAWLYLVRMPMAPEDLGGLGARMLSVLPPRLADAWLTFMMWAVMMVAMMVPSAAPMVMAYARIARARGGRHPELCVWSFVGGYLAIWTLFSAAATAVQLLLVALSWISNALVTTPIISTAILALAGLYQLTPLKKICLGRCQSPIGFFMTHWHDGAAGALRMGLAHGAFCVGCCWILMALLFVTGVMNLAWVAAITVFVILEKATPWGRIIANVSGVVLIVCAAALALTR